MGLKPAGRQVSAPSTVWYITVCSRLPTTIAIDPDQRSASTARRMPGTPRPWPLARHVCPAAAMSRSCHWPPTAEVAESWRFARSLAQALGGLLPARRSARGRRNQRAVVMQSWATFSLSTCWGVVHALVALQLPEKGMPFFSREISAVIEQPLALTFDEGAVLPAATSGLVFRCTQLAGFGW